MHVWQLMFRDCVYTLFLDCRNIVAVESMKLSSPNNMDNCQFWPVGLVVWFSLRVREVPGSTPGQALFVFMNKNMYIAEGGFDPPTSGLWAQHASSAPLCWKLYCHIAACEYIFLLNRKVIHHIYSLINISQPSIAQLVERETVVDSVSNL